LKNAEKTPKSVNLIGFSIYQKFYEGNINEIKKILNLCGIKVISTICAGDSIDNILNLLQAELNIVVCPEYGEEIAKWLYQKYKMPYIVSEEGAPIGYIAVEELIRQIAQKFETDTAPAKELLEKTKARSYLYLSRFNSITGLPKGLKFAVRGDQCIVYPLVKWLYEYLGMIPEAVEVLETDYSKYENKIKKYLNNIGFGFVFKKAVNSSSADIVLADGNTIAQLKLQNKSFGAIEISLPSLGYIDVTEKTFFGTNGSLMIIEYIINTKILAED
jgi:nitrogenase molybdenum-iron protein alpha/beta subunit